MITQPIYSFFVYSKDTKELSVTECGVESCSPQNTYINHVRKEYILHYVERGKGCFSIFGQDFYLGKGSFFLIPPGVKYTYYPDQHDPWKYYWFGFYGSHASRYIETMKLEDNNVTFVTKNPDVYLNIFKQAVESYHPGKHLPIKMLGYLYLLFSQIAEERNPNQEVDVHDDYINRALQYIQDNYNINFSISQLAKHLGLHENYFSRLFKETFGISPKKYITNYKMDIACHLLSENKYKISEISSMLGYKDPFHFSKEFKQIKGCSPKYFVNRPYSPLPSYKIEK